MADLGGDQVQERPGRAGRRSGQVPHLPGRAGVGAEGGQAGGDVGDVAVGVRQVRVADEVGAPAGLGVAEDPLAERGALGDAGAEEVRGPAARPAGLDNSAAQLATARQLQDRFGLRFPLIHASAEQAPFADASFDLAISEYGASIWCDPFAWIPEAARLLRPGGQLIFLVNSVLLMLTVPDTDDQPAGERLLRPYFGMHRFEWAGEESVDFHLGHGEMIRLLRGCGLEVEDLLELRPESDATTRYPFVTLEWARQWPCEEVWKARKFS